MHCVCHLDCSALESNQWQCKHEGQRPLRTLPLSTFYKEPYSSGWAGHARTFYHIVLEHGRFQRRQNCSAPIRLLDKKKPQQTKPYFPDRVRKEKTLMKSYTFCTCASVSSSALKQWMTARYPQLPPPETALNKNCTSQNNVHNTPISIDLVCNLPKHDAVQYEILIEHPVCNKVKDAAIRWQPLKMCACFW